MDRHFPAADEAALRPYPVVVAMKTPRTSASEASSSPKDARRTWSIALVAILLLSIVGAVINVESTEVYVNLRVAPDDFVSACNISETINCDAVERSAWATLWGVPTALWAVMGYLVIVALAAAGLLLRRRRREHGLLLLLSGACVAFGLFLAWLMAFEIGAWCTLCLATDAVNVAMLVLVLVACRAEGCGPLEAIRSDLRWVTRSPRPLVGHLALGGLAVAGGFAATATWVDPPIEAARQAEAELIDRGLPASERRAHALEMAHNPGATATPTRVGDGDPGEAQGCAEGRDERAATAIVQSRNADGHPWIGGAEPAIVIDEFTDYECPHCRGAHMRMRRLLTEHPGALRVVHRHFPLDGSCNALLAGRVFHPRACELSRVAICAGEQGRFWEMNDLLFQRQAEIRRDKTPPDDLARRLELDLDAFRCCMTADATRDALLADLDAGILLGLEGTPAFVVDGKAHLGGLPPEALDALKRAPGTDTAAADRTTN